MPAGSIQTTLRQQPPWRRRIRGATCLAICVIAGLVVRPAPALAIDPTRRLAQCLHRVWQAQQGLPQATITCILQSSDGYIWLGTPGGLVRFDGTRFKAVREAGTLSLQQLPIRAIVEDGDRNLWIGTDGSGLIRWRDDSADQFTTAQGLAADTVHALLADRQGTLWIGTSNGLTRKVGAQLTNFRAADGLPTKSVLSLAEATDGTLWIGGERSAVGKWNGVAITSQTIASLPIDAAVRAMQPAPDGGMWLGTAAGLVRLQGEQEKRITAQEGLADDRIHCLDFGGSDSLWVGTQKGFSRVHGDDIDSFLPQDGLSQSTVYAIREDREGSLWVGTKHGLNQFADRRTIPFTTREGLPTNDVGPVLQDSNGDIWVGTYGAGLARFDGRRFETINAKGGLLSDTIISLANGEPGVLWVGTDRGLNQLHDGVVAASYTAAQGLPENSVHSLQWTDRGELFVGTNQGLVVLRGDRLTTLDPRDERWRQPIVALGQSRGDLLVSTATPDGPYVYRDGRLEEVVRGFRAPSAVDAFLSEGEQSLWLGTASSGLVLIQHQRVTTFGINDGLYDDEIFGIEADDQGRIWMACSKGIFSVRQQDLQSFADGRLARLECLPFSPTDGQRTIECRGDVQPAIWKMRNGQMWFSTIHGLIVVDPNHLSRTLPPAPVVVEDVVVNGTRRSVTELDELPRGANNVSFRYSALSFRSPARITFRYRLDGFDKDWIDAGSRREAFYTNLPPGDYRFRLAARNVDDQLSEMPAPIRFRIRPHFFQSRWFWPLLLTLVAATAWGAYRWRIRWIKARLQAIVTERTRIARELHDTLMQGFSGITMQLQAIWARLPTSDARDNLEEVIGDAGTCLREARRSIAGLRNDAGAEAGLAGAIAQSARQLTETHDITLRLNLAQGSSRLPAHVEYQLLRIAQEALTNAVKHGRPTVIEVSLAYRRDAMRLSIHDNGSGFEPRVLELAAQDRYGLLGMRERATQIGADLSIDSQPGGGTRVTVALPVAAASGDDLTSAASR